ncbi:MAG TPA: hypothetical protein VJ890_06755 [Vineibacter sp.]|nr:hypothetical protein [Vineibacter sp.]
MNRLPTIAALSLALVGLAACGDTTSNYAPSDRAVDLGGRTGDGLAVGAPLDEAAISKAMDNAASAPAGQNRMQVGAPLRAN